MAQEDKKDDIPELLRRQYEAAQKPIVDATIGAVLAGDPTSDDGLLESIRQTLVEQWQVLPTYTRLLASLPPEYPEAWRELIEEIKHNIQSLNNLEVTVEKEPTMFHARRFMNRIRASTYDKNKRVYSVEEVAFFVEDLRSLGIDMRWLLITEYEAAKSELKQNVLHLHEQARTIHQESPSNERLRAVLESVTGVSMKRPTEPYQAIPVLKAESELLYILDDGVANSGVFLNMGTYQIGRNDPPFEKEHYFIRMPNGTARYGPLKDVMEW